MSTKLLGQELTRYKKRLEKINKLIDKAYCDYVHPEDIEYLILRQKDMLQIIKTLEGMIKNEIQQIQIKKVS